MNTISRLKMVIFLVGLLVTILSNSCPSSIVSMLETSPIVNTMPMRDYLLSRGKTVEFDNQVFLLTLESGIKAVFKPCPADEDDLKDYYAEVAAYKACQFMGFDFVPPTVMRTINGVAGSLQLFVETTIDPLASGAYEYALENADPDDIANLKIFYFVFGQWDTGPHNLLIKTEGDSVKLIAIDNAGIGNRHYVRYGELPFVRVHYNEKFNADDYDQPFPFDAYGVIKQPTADDLNIIFNGCVSQPLCQRLAKQELLHYVIYHDSLWIQFHAGHDSFERSFTNYYPARTIEQLKKLTFDILKDQIFGHATNSCLLSNDFLNAILERRDQVLAHYESLRMPH